MKLTLKNLEPEILNYLIILTVLTIPLYQIRLHCFGLSISLLTFNLLSLFIILFFKYRQNILSNFKRESIFWTFTLLFLLSFTPSLVLYPTIHGFGVFVEWLLLPTITAFLLQIHLPSEHQYYKSILFSFSIILFIVDAIALMYLINNLITYDNRLSAFYLSPNHLAMFITPLIPLIIVSYLNTSSYKLRLLNLLTITLALIILFFTESMSSFIGLAISTLIIFFIYIKQCKKIKTDKLIFVFIIFFTLLALFGFHKITNMELALRHNSLFSRFEIWNSAITYLQQNVLLGTYPIDSFNKIYLDLQPLFTPYNTWSAPTPHNLFLTLWISGGFFSVLFFYLICFRWIYIMINNYIKTKNPTTLLLVAGFLTILITGIFDTTFWKNDLSLIFWLIIILGFYNSTPSPQVQAQVKV